ncbi:TVP38/TMEM64 family protein [Marinobacter sp.]|uniref:TVP38/TMEM64 family protein n=1 Tax=Marinobacter sp. TaxID=50741 RepID=UPI00384FCCE5
MKRLPLKLKLTVALGVIVATGALWLTLHHLGMPDNLRPQSIASWLSGQGIWGPVFLVVMMIIAVIVGPIPTLPISAASGLAFGVLEGTAVAATGALAGAIIAFWTSRVLARDYIRERFRDNPILANRGSQKVLFWSVFFTRLVPLFSFALVSYAAGLTAITSLRFMLASLTGMLPMTFVFAGLGRTFEVHPLLSVLAAGLLLIAMTWLPWYLQKYHGARLNAWFDKPQGS